MCWGGVKITNPANLLNIENLVVIITVTGSYCPAIKKQLNEMHIKYITYAELVIANHFADFETVHSELLEDGFSKSTYRNIIMSYLETDVNYLKSVFARNQYFAIPEFNLSSTKEVFVDCGAFAGDTMENFINNRVGTFKKIYLFEPTEKTYKALGYRKERLLREWALEEEQIIVEKKAVSSQNKAIKFTSEINGDKSNRISTGKDDGSEEIQAVTLDSYFEAIKDKPTFIKADIEGAEGEMIQGAERIISEYKPMLAICVYHRIEDLYELPIKLKQLNSNYKMAIRHHMPNYYESVLYCY